jgi:uncharacterized C2H2 Zn-finger protein
MFRVCPKCGMLFTLVWSFQRGITAYINHLEEHLGIRRSRAKRVR